ncbi:MAG: T9SS type A sorting domain-containing protein [Chitinophagales bacterium]|nr:T9SS type A sorting domain-containing protein [Chitinophagales bacterium]
MRQWGTTFGGPGSDQLRALDVNPLGTKIYVGSYTKSNTLPIVNAATTYQPMFGGKCDPNTGGDYCFAIFDKNAQNLLYCTYFGGSNDEGTSEVQAADWYNGVLAVNHNNGDIYISSETNSNNGIATSGFQQTALDGPNYSGDAALCEEYDYFVAKFTDGCSNPPSANITTPGNLQYCYGYNADLMINNPGNGYSIQWYVNGAKLNGQTSISVSPTTDGVYRVQIIKNNSDGSTCTVTTPDWATAKVTHLPSTLNNCCNSPVGLTFLDVTASSFEGFLAGTSEQNNINTTTHTLSNESKQISINGTFTLNENFTFTNCSNVTFASGAEVDLNGYTLTLNGTTFTNCDPSNMWNGIKSGPANSGSKIVTSNNTHIENAITGIDLSDNKSSTFKIQSTIFNNNYIAVSLGSSSSQISQITGCTFKDDANYNLLPPNNTKRTSIYIKAVGLSSLSIGNSTTGNTFDNADYGLYLDHTNATILKNTFQNFSKNDNGNSAYATYGILGSGTSSYTINVGDGSGANKNLFKTGKYYGVYVDGSGGNGTKGLGGSINKNTFTHDDKPITFKNATFPFSILSNDITDATNGITLNNNNVFSGSPPIDVSSNSIALINSGSSSGKYGIYYTYSKTSSLAAQFTGNTITVNSQQYGMQFLNAKSILINSNTVNLQLSSQASDGYYGISCSNVNSATVQCNNISGSSHSSSSGYTSERGISFSNAVDNIINCNTTDNEAFGLEFLGTCTGSFIKGNILKYHDQGISVGLINSTEGVISDQKVDNQGIAPGNQYIGTGSGVFANSGFALYRNVLAFPPIINFEFLNSTDIYYAKSSGSNTSSEKIVRNTASGIKEFDCGPICPNEPMAQMRDASSDSDSSNNVIDSTEVAQIITAVDSIFPSNDAMIWYEKQNLYETTIGDTILEDTIPSLQIFNDTIQSNNIGLFSQVDNLIGSVIQFKEIDWADSMDNNKNKALNILNEIITQRQLESNEKTIDEIYLATIAIGLDTFTEAQTRDILEIANQCPFIGGNAVYLARGMYELMNDSMIYNDNQTCNSIQQIKNASIDKTEVSMNVYPNPSDKMFFLDYSLPLDKEYQFYITNLSGKIIMDIDIYGTYGKREIDISSLLPGFYTMYLSDNNLPKWRSKLIIIR